MKKIKVIFVVFAIPIFGFFIVPIVAYQQLVNQGSVIADNQCLMVNPLIIQRKNSYLASMQIFQSKGSVEAYLKETENYFALSKRFVEAEQAWLMEQKANMDRWDFQLFVPTYIKDAAKAQYDSRDATTMSAKAINEMFETKDVERRKELTQVVIDQTNKAKEAEDKYNRIANSPQVFSFKTRLTKVPESKCPPENFNIPDVPSVPELLNPEPVPINSNEPLS